MHRGEKVIGRPQFLVLVEKNDDILWSNRLDDDIL